MVLLWNMMMAAGYGVVIYFPLEMILNIRNKSLPFPQVLSITLGAYGVLGLLQMLYPIGGLITDVCVGRYKTMMASLVSFWLALIFGSIMGTYYGLSVLHNKDETKDVPVIDAVGVLCFLMSVISFSGFQANSVQFGLD